jgi:hypothetical protein
MQAQHQGPSNGEEDSYTQLYPAVAGGPPDIVGALR